MITCTENYSVNVLLHSAIFEYNSRVLEAFQIGFQYERSMKDLTRNVIVDQRPLVQKSGKEKETNDKMNMNKVKKLCFCTVISEDLIGPKISLAVTSN